eukprot:scpid8499/ scgid1064/ 
MTEGGVEVCHRARSQSQSQSSGGQQHHNEQRSTVVRPASATPPPSGSPSPTLRNATLYSSVTTSVVAEFVPSRPTRQSTNRALRNDLPDVRAAMKQRALRQAAAHKTNVSPAASGGSAGQLSGQYADLEFVAAGGARQEMSRQPTSSPDDHGRVRRDQLMSVYGLERSVMYENLVRPKDGVQASFWLGADHNSVSGQAEDGCSPVPDHAAVSVSHSAQSSSSTGSYENIPEHGTFNYGSDENVAVAAATAAVTTRGLDCGGVDHAYHTHNTPDRSEPCNPSARHPPLSAYEQIADNERAASTDSPGGIMPVQIGRSSTLNYRRRMSSRKRCVTPVSMISRAPTSGPPSSSRRHYEDTDLVTGLPLDMSPPPSATPSHHHAASITSRPQSPRSVDTASLQDLSWSHMRSCSAPEVPSALVEDVSPPYPVSPLAATPDQIFNNGTLTAERLYYMGPPRPPQRRSSLSSKSLNNEALSAQQRYPKQEPGTPPLPPKTRGRQDVAGGMVTVAPHDGYVNAPVCPGTTRASGSQSPEMSLASLSVTTRDCASPVSTVDSSACSSPDYLSVGPLPCRKSWRKSSAMEVFGEFQVHYLGRAEVTSAYGAVDSAMESVVQACAKQATSISAELPTPCCMTVSAATIEVSTSAEIMMRHEVDSVETISAHSGRPSSPTAAAAFNQGCTPTAPDHCQNVFSYVMVEEGVAATCFVFRAKNELACSAAVTTMETALYADVKQFKSMTYPRHVMLREGGVGQAGQFSVKHIGSLTVQSAYNSIDEAGRKILAQTHPAKVEFSFMDLDTDRVQLRKTTSNVIYASHQTHAISSVGAFSEDCRVFGYVLRQRASPDPVCHIFRCSRPSTALAILECIKDMCQESYMSRLRSKEMQESSDEERGSGTPGNAIRNFFSRSRRSTARSQTERRLSERNHKPASPTPSDVEQSADMASRLRTESTDNMVIVELEESPTLRRLYTTVDDLPSSSSDTGLEFPIDYLGTGGLVYTEHRPKEMTKTVMHDFALNGQDAGAVDCGSVRVSMRISSQGVTLTDKNHVMFLKRNYPRRGLFHVDQHAVDKELFSFATLPPAMSSMRNSPIGRACVKVHLFRCTDVPINSVVMALRGIIPRFSG